MKKLLILSLCIFSLSCNHSSDSKAKQTPTVEAKNSQAPEILLNNSNYLVLGFKPTQIKIVKEFERKDYPEYEIIGGYKDDIFLAKNFIEGTIKVKAKFNPSKTFEDFKVKVYDGQLADPDFTYLPEAWLFRTRIREQCSKGINFAGHYTLVIWGCGSPCQGGVLVDRKTGKIVSGFTSELGNEFKKDSRLLIKNIGAVDTVTNLIEPCAFCEVTLEIWNGNDFELIE